MAESDRPRMPRPAATGIASASRPMRIARVTPSISASALALGAFLQIADFVLNFLLGRTRADRPSGAGQVAARDHADRVQQQKDADDDKPEQADDPERLRKDRRRFERRLAARA